MECFDSYVEILRSIPGVSVQLHTAEVTDLIPIAGGYRIVFPDQYIVADHVLVATGHSRNRPRAGSNEERFAQFSRSTGKANYVEFAYPLELNLSEAAIPPGSALACVGQGLTAQDGILFLTEGRGGIFHSDGISGFRYEPSGREPRIISLSRTGVFTRARPTNEKHADIGALEHTGVFLTEDTIDRLRVHRGHPTTLPNIGVCRQLDFELDILPILKLEMFLVYYGALFGKSFLKRLICEAEPLVESFILSRPSKLDIDSTDELCRQLEPFIDEAVEILEQLESGIAISSLQRRHVGLDVEDIASAFKSFRTTLPLGCSGAPNDHRFSWDRMVEPISPRSYDGPNTYSAQVVRFMERDHAYAAEGNLRNPEKAACDAVWRDLRPVLAYAIDFGGLTADSHREFLATYMRYHNAWADGGCLETNQKMLALIRAGIVDCSTGPSPQVAINPGAGSFRIHGQLTGAVHEVETLVDAKLHPLDVEHDASPLIQAMLRRSLIRSWVNTSANGQQFQPGGPEVTRFFEAVAADGKVLSDLTLLGPVTEGILFFQLGLARPNKNHHVLNDVLCWVQHFRRHDPTHHCTTVSQANR